MKSGKLGEVIRLERTPDLSSPRLVCAFHGWNDGGEAATRVVKFLIDLWDARKFAHIEPDDYFDFQITRPSVSLIDGNTRHIEWPENEFFEAKTPMGDVILLLGTEPNLRWRSFCDSVLDLAANFGVKRVASLGAFLADIPHTVETPVTGSASTEELRDRLGLMPSRYEGPTGIVGVLHDSATVASLESASLWAAVPHYLARHDNPRAARSLADKLSEYIEVSIDTAPLSAEEPEWHRRIEEAVAADPDLAEYVKKLDHAFGEERQGSVPMPSGEELADELERFLREQRSDGD